MEGSPDEVRTCLKFAHDYLSRADKSGETKLNVLVSTLLVIFAEKKVNRSHEHHPII